MSDPAPSDRRAPAPPEGRRPRGSTDGAAPKPNAKPPAMPPRRAWLTFLIVIAVNYVLVRILIPSQDAAITIPYTVFKEQVAAGNVESIYSKGAGIDGRFKMPVMWP